MDDGGEWTKKTVQVRNTVGRSDADRFRERESKKAGSRNSPRRGVRYTRVLRGPHKRLMLQLGSIAAARTRRRLDGRSPGRWRYRQGARARGGHPLMRMWRLDTIMVRRARSIARIGSRHHGDKLEGSLMMLLWSLMLDRLHGRRGLVRLLRLRLLR